MRRLLLGLLVCLAVADRQASEKKSKAGHRASFALHMIDDGSENHLFDGVSHGMDTVKDQMSQITRGVAQRFGTVVNFLEKQSSVQKVATDAPAEGSPEAKEKWAQNPVTKGIYEGLDKMAETVIHPRKAALSLPLMQEIVKQMKMTSDGTGFCAKGGELAQYGCAGGPDGVAICKCGGLMGWDFLEPLGLVQPCYVPPLSEEFAIMQLWIEGQKEEAVDRGKSLFFGQCHMTIWMTVGAVATIAAVIVILCSLMCCMCCCGKKKRGRDFD